MGTSIQNFYPKPNWKTLIYIFQHSFQFCHPFKFYIAKTRIIEDEDSKETAESPEKVEGDVEKKMVKKKSKQTSESPQKAEEDNAKSLNNRLYKSPLNVDKSKAETTPR